eukprot:7505-Heterococcus_DN1.PRE.2
MSVGEAVAATLVRLPAGDEPVLAYLLRYKHACLSTERNICLYDSDKVLAHAVNPIDTDKLATLREEFRSKKTGLTKHEFISVMLKYGDTQSGEEGDIATTCDLVELFAQCMLYRYQLWCSTLTTCAMRACAWDTASTL